MKKVLLSLAAVSAIAAAAPAAAQPYGVAYGYQNNHREHRVSIDERQAQIAQRIDRAYRRGEISRAEAYRLIAELRQTEIMEHRLRANGLRGWERDQLEARLDRVQSLLRQERREDDRRYGYGYGRW